MAKDRPYTEAERRQRALFQQAPVWIEWLAAMDEQRARFFSETVPDMPADPWSPEGLDHAEAAALRRFPDMESVELPKNRDIADQFHRYVGETFRRNFGGKWYNVPSFDDEQRSRGFGPIIRDEFSAEYLDVITLLTASMHRRTGSEWSRIFGFVAQEYAAWKEGSST
ncbi:hypothetical protein [Nocardia goodfellowii]|uniref:Uncharacterized protein n=1 Tax=Nocardia goodfellowii TaxID=882446 RepID=A0ABS4QSX6_9NOCA|nr:hypothetical protein [Nocardia goodfellowii]MBP2194183.1 hypothetical protein [Nocardia goodfellowii]